jgi:cell fate regulator YaaT (PSP1 superfamily)
VPDIQLKSDFPPDAGLDDLDATTFPMFATGPTGTPPQQAGGDVAGVVGVRFVAAGRIQWADAGDAEYSVGERVIVDSERGPRLATIATPPTRKTTRERGVRRVIRRANESDLRGERDSDTEIAKALRIAKDAASGAKLPIKVYRVELAGGGGPTGGPSSGLRGAKLNVYYTCDERVDVRGFLATVGRETGARIELRQLGVRDEAKAVGGIGSCGLTLCCTTWLPDFVPVSIKMAKDQGLVLSPTKVAGQCGRLKCCLVYEQAGYAELRKGLPKLGKRVISERGEGRVVEVDVLRQRLRVSYGMGDSEVLPATSVKPLFPPGGGPGGGGDDERGPRGERAPRGERGGRDDRGRGERRDDRRADGPAAPGAPTGPSEAEHEDIDPAKLAGELYADLDDDEDAGPTDDPSSMHHVANEPDEPDVPDNGLASDNPSSQHVSADDTDDE